MDSISLTKSIQKRFNQHVQQLKVKITEGDIKVHDHGVITKCQQRGVIFLSHIPHGFYEEEMRSYFNQFGAVTRLRLMRSHNSGRSKGYAFIEFKNEEVAQIVADTMNNYLMYDRILKCKVVPPEDQHKGLFANAIRADLFPKQITRITDMEQKNKLIDEKKEAKIRKNKLKQIAAFRMFFEERGIEFNFKVNDPHGYLDTNGNGLTESGESDSSAESEQEEEFGVLEIDESDDDIEFRTPPQVKKIIKRSSTPSVMQQPKVKTLNGTPSKFPKIQPLVTQHGKGAGRKFETRRVDAKGKPNLAKSLKPKAVKKKDKMKMTKMFKASEGKNLTKVMKEKVLKDTKKGKTSRMKFGARTKMSLL